MPHAAFLSFADPDKELANCLSKLFTELRRRAFVSTEPRAERKTTELRRSIIEAIKDSLCFVPIYTPQSVRREWVLYESGVADAFEKKRFPACSASVSPSEILDLPVANDIVYDLSDREQLVELMAQVCANAGDSVDEAREHIKEVIETRPSARGLAERVNVLAKRRWVFVAGNYPENAAARDSGINWFSDRAKYLDRLKEFSEMLTEELLRKGFSVRACPQVEAVGMHVTAKAAEYLNKSGRPPHVDFGIGGIHPIDREARRLALTGRALDKWRDHIMEFRKSYLETQEWLILLAGNEGTEEECEAARQSNVKVVTIPCFGGKAAKLYKDDARLRKGPCRTCKSRDGRCDRERVRSLVAALAGRRHRRAGPKATPSAAASAAPPAAGASGRTGGRARRGGSGSKP